MEDDLKKNEMEDDLNFKAVLLRLFNNNKPQKQMVLTPQRFFGMQPYFDPTRKPTSEKKSKTTLKRNKNRRQPQKNEMEENLHRKMEDNLKKMKEKKKQP